MESSYNRRLRGKTALITGASRGIGLAIARALAAEGCNLIITARNRSSVEKAAKELARRGIRTLAVACDVRDPSAVKALARRRKISSNVSTSSSTTPVSRSPIFPCHGCRTIHGKKS